MPWRFVQWAFIASGISIVIRYFADPSFWLDEAYVAESLRTYDWKSLFGPLLHGQVFPRFQLLLILVQKELLGYSTGNARFLPTFFALAALQQWQIFFRNTLSHRDRLSWTEGLVMISLILSNTFFLSYGPQLKPYSMDFFLALWVWNRDDATLERSFQGKKTWSAFTFSPLLILFSYPFVIFLAARVVAYWVKRKIHLLPAVRFLFVLLASSAILYFFDIRHHKAGATESYWARCILGKDNFLRVALNMVWGWQAFLPRPITLGLAILQALGIFWILKRFKREQYGATFCVFVFFAVLSYIFASLVVQYPLCTGRLTLPLMPLFGAFAIFGLRFIQGKLTPAFITWALLFSFFSGREFARHVASMPEDNLRPFVKIMKHQRAEIAYVVFSAMSQVKTLPEGLPVKELIFDNELGDEGLKSPAQLSHFPRDREFFVVGVHMDSRSHDAVRILRTASKSFEVLSSTTDQLLAKVVL